MMRQPDIDILPRAVQSAERLIGSLVPCGPGYRSVGWPDSSSTRASVLRRLIPTKPICAAVLFTAAWVWGADWHISDRCECSTLHRTRLPHVTNRDLLVHEFRLSEHDVVLVGGVRVANRQRTLFDLLFLPEDRWGERALAASALLAKHERITDMEFVDQFLLRKRPFMRRAESRFEEVMSTR